MPKNILYNYSLVFACFAFINSFMLGQLTEKKTLRIAIVGAHDEKYDHIGKYAHINKQAYAARHGYDTFLYVKNLATERMPYWSKIVAVRKHLKDYDWIFMLDSDALIMNNDLKLEDLIDEKYDFITTRDCLLNINSGQFLVKNSPWATEFLTNWFETGDTHIPPGFDNGALIKLYRESDEARKRIKIIPLRMLSSYLVCPKWYQIDGEYRQGDFIIHLAGVSHERKEVLIKEFYDKLYASERVASFDEL